LSSPICAGAEGLVGVDIMVLTIGRIIVGVLWRELCEGWMVRPVLFG
jgi:hypothetical protein